MGSVTRILSSALLIYWQAPAITFAQTPQCGTVSTCPPVSTPLNGTELFFVSQTGVTKKITAAQLGAAISPGQVMPVVLNVAALKAASPWSSTLNSVYRAGYTFAGDGGGMVYNWFSTSCTTASGNGDNGAEVKPNSGGGCWRATFPSVPDVKTWGALGDGTAQTTQLQLAVTWACAAPAHALRFSNGDYRHTGLTVTNSCNWFGDGRGVTYLKMTAATGDDVYLNGSGSEKFTITDMSIYEVAYNTKSSGFAVHFSKGYFPTLNRVDITGFNGVFDDTSATMTLRDVDMIDMNGTDGVRFKGLDAVSNQVFGAELFNVNGATKSSSQVSTNRQMKWLNVNSYSYSVNVHSAKFQYGDQCVVMDDDVNAGASSYPAWLTIPHIECDHQYDNAVEFRRGHTAWINAGSWIGSSSTGAGIVTRSTWTGGLRVDKSRIVANAKWGIDHEGGTDNQFTGNIVKANSVAGAGLYDEMFVAGGVSNWKAVDNSFSHTDGDVSSTDATCLNVATGAGDHINIRGNNVYDCSGGTMQMLATGKNVFTSANDGYNQGTWVPVVAGDGTAGSVSYTTRTGFFHLENGVVTATAYIVTTSVSGGTGSAIISGLPFTSTSTANYSSGCSISTYGGITLDSGYTQLGAGINAGVTSIKIYESGSGKALTALPIANVPNSSGIVLTCSYMVTP
jgi:hypothetical protein